MIHLPAFFKRNKRNDCGAVALTTIAWHHGISIKVQQVRDLLSSDGNGSNLYALLTTANTLGFKSKGVKGSYAALDNIPLHAIAHMIMDDLGHFVVLHGWKPNFVIISDRGAGVRRVTREKFCEHRTGYILIAIPDGILNKKYTHLDELVEVECR